MYSQAPLLKLLSAGKVPGESGIPEHIETVMSNVFLFPEKVYKLYKNDNTFVNQNFFDLSDTERRFAFSTADFEWNQQLANEIYTDLLRVRVNAEMVQAVDGNVAPEELIIVTKRLPIGTSLFEHLQKGDLVTDDFYAIGHQFAEREGNLVYHDAMPNETVQQNMIGRHRDVVEWVKDVEADFPREERDICSAQLKKLIQNVYESDSTPVGICVDIHSLNAFYVEHKLYPFDCYSVKYDWRFGPPIVNLYRLATDVFALAGEEEFRAVIRGYSDYRKMDLPSNETDRLFVMYSALIMVSYLYMLGKTDSDKRTTAVKYHDFLRQYAAT